MGDSGIMASHYLLKFVIKLNRLDECCKILQKVFFVFYCRQEDLIVRTPEII